MNTQQIDEKAVFNAARRLADAAEREEYVAEACGDDQAAIQRIRELLRVHQEEQSFLESPVADLTPTTDLSSIAEQPGTIIGPYKLLQQIGEGGMGVVFMAEQTQPVQRTVALKIIKPGMDTRQVIARLEAERQALAMMDHPNIARVIDAGTTETGRPYFVMDLVKGLPITDYCDRSHFTIRQRLELFIPVCHAVQHAHQKGIIHRDLKPSNVLVAEYDGRPVPKVIDFGVAKATAQKLTERTMFTQYGQIVGTFEYMSPEQARFNQLDVDTRSDIYSLGVLLYELLAGSTPLEKERLRSAAFDEILHIISEEDPPPPSTRLSTPNSLNSLPLAERISEGVSAATTIAANRHTEPAKLAKELSGELDWIVMKCLEKERNRRYETASALAADLNRFLRDEPVVARPTTKTYRLKRLIRRHKGAVLAGSATLAALVIGLTLSSIGAGAAIFVALVIGFALASIGFFQARQQAQFARTEAARSQQVAQFLKDMLEGAGPAVARGRDVTLLREILDKTAQRIPNDLRDQPDVRGDLCFTLGKTYADIGDDPRAVLLLSQACESYRASHRQQDNKLAISLSHLAYSQRVAEDVKSAAANSQLALEIARNSNDDEILATCLYLRARFFSSRAADVAEAEPYVREALNLYRKLGNDPVSEADCMTLLAAALSVRDDKHEAELLARQALNLFRKHLGPDHPKTAQGLFRVARILLMSNKLEEAEGTFRETLAIYRRLHDEDHYFQTYVLRLLAETLIRRGKLDEAEVLLRQSVESYPTKIKYPRFLAGKFVYRDQWPVVCDELSRTLNSNPANFDNRFCLAIAYLMTGRQDDYRQLCHDFLARSARSNVYRELDFAAKSALLLPVQGMDFELACQLAERASRLASSAIDQKLLSGLLMALCEYRRMHYSEAKKLAERVAGDKYIEPEWDACAWYLLSATCAHLQQTNLARTALRNGDDVERQYWASIPDHYLDCWHHWTVARLLRLEASELLKIAESTDTHQ